MWCKNCDRDLYSFNLILQIVLQFTAAMRIPKTGLYNLKGMGSTMIEKRNEDSFNCDRLFFPTNVVELYKTSYAFKMNKYSIVWTLILSNFLCQRILAQRSVLYITRKNIIRTTYYYTYALVVYSI